MPKLIKPLSEQEVRKAKPSEKIYKLYDGKGLHITIFPNGIKRWEFDFTFNSKRNTMSFGNYPEVSLKDVRIKRTKARENIKKGINPSKSIKIDRNAVFEKIAREYFDKREDLSDGYIKDSLHKLNKDIFPYFSDRDINNIEPLEMLQVLQKIDKRGSSESAKRTFNIVSRVYGYAVTTGKAKYNILNGIDKKIAFRTVKKENYAHTIDPQELKQILLAIEQYTGDYNTKMALTVLPYLFVRPSNIRFMEWNEIDFDKNMWIIPKEKMKVKKDHIVPLSATVVNTINQMKDISYHVSKYVFPSRISNTKTLSENTLNLGLKRMGFNVTSHGFRHTASTILHENIHKHQIQSDVIEIQLAHTVGNQVQQTYNKAIHIQERIKLMNWWSDYLDNLKSD